MIKVCRQRKGLKQDDVAVGICTPSYLSRIENGVVIADATVYELLLERLGIAMIREEEQLTAKRTLLETIYEKLLSNEVLINKEITSLEILQRENFQQEIELLAALVYSRYLLSIDALKEASELLSNIEPSIIWSQTRVTQIYIGVTTYAHLSYFEFRKIIRREEQHQVSNYMITASPFEQANYLYHLAFAYHRSYSSQQALDHIEIATQTFSHQYKPLFQLKLYSMKGVILNSLHRFQEALVEYEAGEDLLRNVESIQTPRQWSSLYNNIAYCYECQHLFKEAIFYYEQANHHEEDLHSAINWMRACLQKGDLDALNNLFRAYPKECFRVLHHQYQWQLLHYASQSQQNLDLASLKELEERAFPHFERQEYYSLILFYAPLWATFYEKLHAYKQASICYRRAFTASENVRQRMSK